MSAAHDIQGFAWERRAFETARQTTDAFSEIGRHIAHAAKLEAWHEFDSYFRRHGPELERLLDRLGDDDASTSGEASAPPFDFQQTLLGAGLSDERVELVLHAERMGAMAEGLGPRVAQLRPEECSEDVLRHLREAEAAHRMHFFAWIVLNAVAHQQIPATAPGVPHAITLAVESSREVYAQRATALELADEAAA